MSRTLSWYSENAGEFTHRTIDIDCRELYSHFLPRLTHGARILDAGCGSGRDSMAFIDAGFDVHAMDAVPEIAAEARRLTGLNVEVCRFEDFRTDRPFDGIWACASLLHVPESELPQVTGQLGESLKTGGLFYMSFKYGSEETVRGPRSFTDMDEEGLSHLAEQLDQLRIMEMWTTEDRRKRRNGEIWMNALWEKR